jgi:putative flippase GtrA
MQKYWTFTEKSSTQTGKQFALYVAIAGVNIGANTLIVYILTGLLGLHYLIAQFIGASVVAIWSYFLYRHILFKSKTILATETVRIVES